MSCLRSSLAAVFALFAVVASAGFGGLTATAAGPVSGSVSDPVGVWPLNPVPEVVHVFDPPTTPYGAGNRGVDLLGRPGQVVRSALPGTVAYAGLVAGKGVVVVDHGTTRTTYEPVRAVVTVGTRVEAGRPIGTLEAAPSHCPPRACLHWGWIEGASTYLDPLRLVGVRPVRLLPLGGLPDAGATSVPAKSEVPGVLPVLAALRALALI